MSSLFNIAAGGQAGFYDYQINDSLRFDDGSTANLSKTLPDSGDRQTWTFSAWVKRSAFPSNGTTIFGSFINSQNYGLIRFLDGDGISFVSKISDVNGIDLTTNALFRDPSSWYHIVVAVDTTQSTSTDRVKIYVNGTQITSFSTSTYPSQNYNSIFNYNILHYVGRYGGHTSANYDGYMAEVHLIDGQQLSPTSFGKTKSGVWIPKDTSGLTFGTNGFRLEFGDSAAIGDDTSGNGNDFTATNLSAHDVVPDSPTLNYSTLNPLRKHAGATLSEGNLTVTHDSGGGEQPATFAISSGKWYWEVKQSTQYAAYGLLQVTANPSSASIVSGYHWYGANGSFYTGTTAGTNLGTFGSSDIISIAYNADDNELTFYKNGVSAGTESIVDNEYYPDFAAGTSVASTVNFGQDSTFAGATTAGGNSDANGYGDFKYAVPSGYLALNSANLPEPSITPLDDDLPEDYFNTVLYTGNGSTQSITGVGFQPNFSWFKSRTNAAHHVVHDSVRGADQRLFTSLTNAEDAAFTGQSFDSDGFTATNTNELNANTQSYVMWNWLAGGTAVSNTDGTITSSVSANTEAGFSIATYTEPSGSFSFGHGLGITPDMFIFKRRDGAENWIVWHKHFGSPTTNGLYLDSTLGQFTTGANWLTAIDSDTITITSGQVSGAGTKVCYAFKSIEGYSKIGTYTGNGSTTDGTFVYTGFRPAWVMVKKTNGAGNWVVTDNKRDPVNVIDALLSPDLPNVETDTDAEDFTSNGFKMRDAHNTRNASGGNYIYMAFAEMPFKYANAR